MPEQTIDVALFCGECEAIYNLSTPWENDGAVYATDACVCLRIDSTDGIDVGSGVNRPDVYRPFVDTDKVSEWLSLPEFEPCKLCQSNDVELVNCKECGGNGIAKCFECGSETACPECDGEGVTDEYCPHHHDAVEMGVHRISHYYLNRISTLPNIKWGCVDGSCYVFLKFDGGTGVLHALIQDGQ